MLINENLIALDLEANDKEDAIRRLGSLAQQAGKVISLNAYVSNVLEREQSYSTGVGNGIAIPHGKSSAVKEAMIVFGKLKNPIDWDSIDAEPVDMIFLLGVPDQNIDNIHLKILSQLSRKLIDDNFISILRNSKTAEEVLTALKDIKVS